jgi:hypothetical protein
MIPVWLKKPVSPLVRRAEKTLTLISGPWVTERKPGDGENKIVEYAVNGGCNGSYQNCRDIEKCITFCVSNFRKIC